MGVYGEPDLHPADLIDNARSVLALLREALGCWPPGHAPELSESAWAGLYQVIASIDDTLRDAAGRR